MKRGVVEVWTDGSGTRSGPVGWAAILRFVDGEGEVHEREVVGSGDEGTNNVAELLAVIDGLEALRRPCNVLVVTDSEYVMFGFAPCDGQPGGRVERWKRRGWMTNGKPRKEVANRVLWESLDAAVSRHLTVSWRHVEGHTGIEMNERADRLAGDARRRAKEQLEARQLTDAEAAELAA